MSTTTKTGLAIEGGGLRSAFATGVLIALHESGLTGFDYVAGTSAGACCGANFVAGEPEKSRTITEDYLTSKRFVNFGKIFSKENIMDIDYLIDEVCRVHVPLATDKIRRARATLLVPATEYYSGAIHYFNSRDHDVHEILRASCAIPYLYRKQAVYRGQRYVDGGMKACIPIKVLLEKKCEHLIVVGTRHLGYRKKREFIPKWIHSLAYADSPAIGEAFRERHRSYNQDLDLVFYPPPGIVVHYIAPRTKLEISRTTRERETVKRTVEIGYREGLAYVEQYAERLNVFNPSP